MRFLLLLLSFIPFLGVVTNAQTLCSGIFANASTGETISRVVVHNLQSGTTTFSDIQGAFSIKAGFGDTVLLSILGYEDKFFVHRSYEPEQFRRLSMVPRVIIMDSVVIHAGPTQYQIDSLQNRKIYGKKVEEKPAKFKLNKGDPLYGGGTQGAIGFDAPISSLIQKHTKKYKKLKAFQDRYKQDELDHFAESRYTPELVMKLTNLNGDSLYTFMLAFPIEYNFARAASNLELMMWIKYNYKAWLKENPSFPSYPGELDSLKK